MLSVCIPVFNHNQSKLIEQLSFQLSNCEENSEIILIDDASDVEFRQANSKLCKQYNINYIQLEKNIGRSAIRNLFLKYHQYDYLLFLDCDSELSNNKFIKNYIEQISNKHLVVCGGRSYIDKTPQKTHLLRQKYGSDRECAPAISRNKTPHRSFMTNNFIIHKKILSKINFDERIAQYGHEDTLFGYRLKQNNIPLVHIDNTVRHDYTESNLEFLQKTESAIKNLVKIREFIDDKSFDDELKLLRVYNKIKCFKLDVFLSFFHRIFRPLMIFLIKKNIGGLFLFDLYKLTLFCKLRHHDLS